MVSYFDMIRIFAHFDLMKKCADIKKTHGQQNEK